MPFVSRTNGVRRRIRLDQWNWARDRETGLEYRVGTTRSEHQRPEAKRDCIQPPQDRRCGDQPLLRSSGHLWSPPHRIYLHSDTRAQPQAPWPRSTATRTNRDPSDSPGTPCPPGTWPQRWPALPLHLSSSSSSRPPSPPLQHQPQGTRF